MTTSLPLRILPCALLLAASARAATPPHIDPASWPAQSTAALAAVDSYTAIFHKQERVRARLLPEEVISLRFKRPFKIHMRWLRGPGAGRTSVFVKGADGDRIRVKEAGLVGLIPITLDPTGSLAMKGNRHPITDAGIENLLLKIADNVRRALSQAELTFIQHGIETVWNQPTLRVEGRFPRDPRKGYYCYRAVLWLDLERSLPVLTEIYDTQDDLVERYGYEELRLNAGLTDGDF
jgi:hypothetical protein